MTWVDIALLVFFVASMLADWRQTLFLVQPNPPNPFMEWNPVIRWLGKKTNRNTGVHIYFGVLTPGLSLALLLMPASVLGFAAGWQGMNVWRNGQSFKNEGFRFFPRY